MSSSKNIFAIISYPFLPATTGGEISTMNILNFMAKKNQVSVFTVEPYRAIDTKQFDFELIIGMPFKASRYLNFFLLFKIFRLIKERKSEVVFFDQPWMGWMIPFIQLFSGKRVFIRSNNIEYLRFKSMGKAWWSMLYMYEKFAYKMADLVIFVSDIDQEKAIHEFDLEPHKTLLTPYGVPYENIPIKRENASNRLRELYQIPASCPVLLFFATMSYGPNYEAVEIIAGPIYESLKNKLANFQILICGKNLPQAIVDKLSSIEEIRYCGFVEDIELYIDGADLMINPIISGGGIKTKAVDTLSRSQVVISTKTGAEGIQAEVCGDYLQVVEDKQWEAFAEAIVHQLNKGKQGEIPASFFGTYSWPGIIENLNRKIAELKF
ncbi:MAG: glycosyltransferase family 4 protein [Bacteroidia bacterium]